MESKAQATDPLQGTYITEADLLLIIPGKPMPARTLRRLELRGCGPAVTRIGRRKLYRREAVMEWLRSMETSTKPVSRLDRAGSSAEV